MKLFVKTICLLVIVILSSCSKDNDSTSESITVADIIGTVNLIDENTNLSENSDMHVKIDGVQPEISTTTNIDGIYILKDVPFGIHTLIYEKQGFGTFKNFGIEHYNTGSSTSISNTLSTISTTEVLNLDAIFNGSSVGISVTTYPAGNNENQRYIRFFYSTSSNVSDENYMYYTPKLTLKFNPIEISLSASDLANMGFASSSTVFVKVYGDSYFSNEYYDQDLGRNIFPNLNTNSADAVSFVVP